MAFHRCVPKLAGLIALTASLLAGGCTAQDTTEASGDAAPAAKPAAERESAALHPDAGRTIESFRDGTVMALVPAGEFPMGKNDGYADERPRRMIFVDSFYINKQEITVEQYQRFLRSPAGEGHRPDPAYGARMPADYFSNPRYRNHPVVNVNWEDARAYCQWAGNRLPTEAEWEKAARGPEGRLFPWGSAFGESRCNWEGYAAGDSEARFTLPVDSFPQGASPYGALNMSGNVWEWVDAWYRPYPGNFNRDPLYEKNYRVLRGGSWLRNPLGVSAAARDFCDPELRFNSIGFRCARSLDPQQEEAP